MWLLNILKLYRWLITIFVIQIIKYNLTFYYMIKCKQPFLKTKGTHKRGVWIIWSDVEITKTCGGHNSLLFVIPTKLTVGILVMRIHHMCNVLVCCSPVYSECVQMIAHPLDHSIRRIRIRIALNAFSP